jgi:branched-chain amino acid transport system ATP-binding protein
VYENVLVVASYGGRRRGGSASLEACLWALEQAHLSQRVNVPAGQLTLLERKRLELARALATRPKVLLLDEIAGGLTEAEMDELIVTIDGIRSGGMSIIWIEHIVHALLRVVDRMLAMDYGKVLIEGDPHEVMASEAVRNVYLGAEVG